ncbi:DNA cytosine methyltransferase [Rhodococcus pyridinivorans]|uniref:DNA cytosine methyltransferase n=1 Tax=Rhodococcus pyridinivorans TaxID=103816 RepID=UPI002659EEF6|nr:DNA cytosine methyltransferase [Rhodococcus pyridinivorans]
MEKTGRYTSLVVCAGAGGMAQGLERAGFDPVLTLDNRKEACDTLRFNRPDWHVLQMELQDFDPIEQGIPEIDLLAAGLPRLRGSASASRVVDPETDFDLVKATVWLSHAVRPRAILLDNVPDLVTADVYAELRSFVQAELEHLGYRVGWHVVNAVDYGVPQDRKHGILIALPPHVFERFVIPPTVEPRRTVGEVLRESMRTGGWSRADEWAALANRPAPTLVGGSWDRGGADLGPTGSKRKWEQMGVDGGTVADAVPTIDFAWNPVGDRSERVRLTVAQAAILQGFPEDWRVAGLKTARYRLIANAMPPPLAHALGSAIADALG